LSGERGRALRQYQQLREALRRDLDVDPAPAAQRLYRQIWDGRFPARPAGEAAPAARAAPAATPPTNLPAEPTSFVGRERELADLARLLDGGARLVTLTGPGGCGKTRLALRAAGRRLGRYPDGVWLVELAPLADPALVPQALAAAVGIREQPGEPVRDTLVAALRDKRALLVLDNGEHLRAAVADLAAALLDACPSLTVLATSRRALGLAGETAWPVPALATPDPRHPPAPDDLARYDAARLFLDRAAASRPGFAPTPRDAATIARICARLDGQPLALELAAARVKVLAVEEIEARLADALALLAGRDQAMPPRQRTLRATLDRSHALLTAPEQALFRRLAAFAGGWLVEAVETVCADGDTGDTGDTGGVVAADVLDLLATLIDHALVVSEEDGGRMRGRLLEPVRHYALEQLRLAGEEAAVRERHLAWYLVLAEAARGDGPERAHQWDGLERDHDDLRAALGWALAGGDVATGARLAVRLAHFWSRRGHLHEGRRWLVLALAVGPALPDALRAAVTHAAGNFALSLGETERARLLFAAGLTLARQVGDRPGEGDGLNCLGLVWWQRGDYERAAEYYEAALAVYRELTRPDRVAALLHNLGLARLRLGAPEQAEALQRESLALFEAAGSQEGVAVTLHALGLGLLAQGRAAEAAALLRESLRVCQTLVYKAYIAHCLEALAQVASVYAQAARAARLGGAAEALREAIGVSPPLAERVGYEASLAAARAHLPPGAFEAAWAAGRALPLEETIAAALVDDEAEDAPRPGPDRPAAARPLAALTAREREVADLLARGLTNAQIAAALGMATRTADTHVGRILHKLGLPSRAEVAARLAAPPAPPPPAPR
ncbi:MAG TPA: LuxR C-terminal-related transcriptional regulator, partial [Thermomicrobiales bacterium]|nr:LuxR C-terminal-related transcriptional regulator [Thermomicrobiales bacterium]